MLSVAIIGRVRNSSPVRAPVSAAKIAEPIRPNSSEPRYQPNAAKTTQTAGFDSGFTEAAEAFTGTALYARGPTRSARGKPQGPRGFPCQTQATGQRSGPRLPDPAAVYSPLLLVSDPRSKRR